MSTSPSVTFNVILSGVSVSGDVDTLTSPVKVQMGNTDRIGYAEFALQNAYGTYSAFTQSGNAAVQIDALFPGSGSVRLFNGTIETLEPEISVQRGSVAVCKAYDLGQELLGIISPDARPPSLLDSSGLLSLTSGDQGIGTLTGMDLAIYVSGANTSSGATLSSLMAQFFGVSGDFSGSQSGKLFSLKSYISGQTNGTTWKAWYYPDASGGVIANDNNMNYWIPFDTLRVKREYGWDVLRKICRQGIPIDSAGNHPPFEVYVGVSGDIHIFTSGSYEFITSGVVLQYYAAGKSGSSLNNVVSAKIPFDTVQVKNYVLGWFPPQTVYPIDTDFWTDRFAYSGVFWSGIVSGRTVSLSGDNPATSLGSMAITVITKSGTTASDGSSAMILTLPTALNLKKYNVSGFGNVSLVFQFRAAISGAGAGSAPPTGTSGFRNIQIFDSGGNFILQSGIGQVNGISDQYSNWTQITIPIFGSGAQFLSGDGRNSGWVASATFPDLTMVKQIKMGMIWSLIPVPSQVIHSVDNMYFSFYYPFSPVVASNSGSVGMGYGRRYAVVEFPDQVTDIMASGLMNYELNSRMGQKGVATFIVKDNPLTPQSVQLNIKPGQVFVADAPNLNTGSGMTFYYWRAIDVTHEWSVKGGFLTTVRAVPWFSGTVTAPNSNQIDYQTPLMYQEPMAPSDRNDFMPTNKPWYTPGARF